MGTDKKFNDTLCPLMESKNGNFSWRVTQEVYDAFQGVQIGGRVIVKLLKPEQRKNGDRSPIAYLEHMTAAEVSAFEDANKITQGDSL